MASRKKSIAFDFTPKAYEDITSLQKELKQESLAPIVRFGLKSLEFLFEQKKAGNRILVDDGKKITEVTFPYLEPGCK